MPEVENEVKVFEVNYICDKCGIGKMKPTGEAQLSDPPQYPHKCTHCGHTESYFNNMYPIIRYQIK